MHPTPFFSDLRKAYEAELHDLSFDSDGKHVLKKHLAERRKELPFLVQMMAASPEMVSVVFHQAFRFLRPEAMHQLLATEAESFPDWETLGAALTLEPWAQPLADAVLKEPEGEWLLAVAAGLEFMHSHPSARPARSGDDAGDSDDEDGDKPEGDDEPEDADEREAREQEAAGQAWMESQGFDRKE